MYSYFCYYDQIYREIKTRFDALYQKDGQFSLSMQVLNNFSTAKFDLISLDCIFRERRAQGFHYRLTRYGARVAHELFERKFAECKIHFILPFFFNHLYALYNQPVNSVNVA